MADICLIMDSHAAAFNVIFRRLPAPGQSGRDPRAGAGPSSVYGPSPTPAGQAGATLGRGRRYLPQPTDGTLLPQAGSRRPTLTFWQLLTLGERQSLSAAARPVTFRAGTFICRQGERADHVLIIKSGWTRVFTEHMDGIRGIAERGRATW